MNVQTCDPQYYQMLAPMNEILSIILITSAVLLIYHHIIYPVVVAMFATLLRAFSRSPVSGPPDVLPSITILVPAHNEANIIARKILNLLETDYPASKLSIVIALDGCTDTTRFTAENTLAEAPSTPMARQARDILRIVEFRNNIGKVAVLNHEIARIDSDIVVLSDASATLAPDGLRRAIRHFESPLVGVVAPTYRLIQAGSSGEQAYTDYLTRLRRDEAWLDSPLGCHGACYLFRRRLWTPLPADTINDDFILPLRIVADGFRCVYEMSVVSLELETTSRHQEFRRRVRIGAGNMQQSIRLAGLLDPRRPWLAFMFASGKGLRPFMPFVAVSGLLAALGLAIDGFVPVPIVILTASAAAITAALSMALRSRPRALKWFAYLVEGYAASLIGSITFIIGRRIGPWQHPETKGVAIVAVQVWPNDETENSSIR